MYNQWKSKDYVHLDSAQDRNVKVKYGIGNIEGDFIQDRVCLDLSADKCVDKYKILAVE